MVIAEITMKVTLTSQEIGEIIDKAFTKTIDLGLDKIFDFKEEPKDKGVGK